MPRVPVKHLDFEIGKPLRWDVYDTNGQLVFPKGTLIASEEEKQKILARRHVRQLDLRFDIPKEDEAANESRREVRVLLDETRIRPGEAMQIQSTLDSTRYTVRLIGYLKGKSIIVTNPIVDGSPIYLKDGQAFVARIFSGKFVFGFPCTVLASGMKPYAHLHLSYPVDVVGVNIRKGERVRLRVIAAFDTDDGRAGAGVIVDLSSGGAYILSKSRDLTIGCHLVLKFKIAIANVDYVLELPGCVRSTRANEEEPALGDGFGIQFTQVTAEENLVLASFIYQQIAGNQAS